MKEVNDDGRVVVRDPTNRAGHRRKWHAVPAHTLARLGLPVPPIPPRLTPRQGDALAALRSLRGRHGREPRVGEVARELGVTVQSAAKLLDRLRLAGWLGGGRGPTAAEAENRRLRAVVAEGAAFLCGLEVANGQRQERDRVYRAMVGELA